MQFLRGTENLMMDLAWGVNQVYRLRDLVHEFFMREIALWTKTDVDGISFMDDWGTQTNLLISSQMWREVFKPLYADYCQLIHGTGKFAFFHSDGHIVSIIPDLIEIGVDAVNAQLFCLRVYSPTTSRTSGGASRARSPSGGRLTGSGCCRSARWTTCGRPCSACARRWMTSQMGTSGAA
ncbi:MAG TPA: hypothetical protein VMY80_02805 [Anaerolineae bacterium]|nr:hypothetical protein [Anaerolineae bacterium]